MLSQISLPWQRGLLAIGLRLINLQPNEDGVPRQFLTMNIVKWAQDLAYHWR